MQLSLRSDDTKRKFKVDESHTIYLSGLSTPEDTAYPLLDGHHRPPPYSSCKLKIYKDPIDNEHGAKCETKRVNICSTCLFESVGLKKDERLIETYPVDIVDQ